jgi:hypothetical protein
MFIPAFPQRVDLRHEANSAVVTEHLGEEFIVYPVISAENKPRPKCDP